MQYVVDPSADLLDRSGRLFGRQHALRIYCAIGQLPEVFSATQVRDLSGAPTSDVSRELRILRDLGLVSGKRAQVTRHASHLWQFAQALFEEWSGETMQPKVTSIRQAK